MRLAQPLHYSRNDDDLVSHDWASLGQLVEQRTLEGVARHYGTGAEDSGERLSDGSGAEGRLRSRQ